MKPDDTIAEVNTDLLYLLDIAARAEVSGKGAAMRDDLWRARKKCEDVLDPQSPQQPLSPEDRAHFQDALDDIQDVLNPGPGAGARKTVMDIRAAKPLKANAL